MKSLLGLLFLPLFMLTAIAVYSFGVSAGHPTFDGKDVSGAGRMTREAFVAGVLRGETKGGPDQYEDAMRFQQAIISTERMRCSSVLGSLRDLGWIAAYGVLFQSVAILYIVRRRWKRPSQPFVRSDPATKTGETIS